MRSRTGKWFLLIAAAFCHATVVAGIAPEQLEFFEKRIRPVLADRCYGCHSSGAESLKAELRIDSAAGMRKGGVSGKPTIIPGNADASELVHAIRYTREDLRMPPPGKGGQLTQQQISDVIAWIKMGAPDPRTEEPVLSNELNLEKARAHWAFQPVNSPPLPELPRSLARWARTPIDHFIGVKLDENGLQPSLPADKRTLIRRATYDLTGLPPTIEEVENFLRDKSPDAFVRAVDRLLASPHYGERWGRYWMDVARFADTKGYVYGDREETKFVHSAAYRDWVIRALNEDMPYDRFLKLQMAADQMPDADRESLAAMGFLTLGRRFLGVVHDIIDDRIDVVTRGTLGLTVSCARCHDHKYDPIPTRDYYSLYGIFAGSSERTVPLNAAPVPAKVYLEFETELRRREEKFRTTFNQRRDEVSAKLRSRTRDYLAAVINVEKMTGEVFYEMLGPDDLNPVVVRQWNSYLLATSKKFHPVWAPWHGFAQLQQHEFANKAPTIIPSITATTNKLNPVILKAFSDKTPSFMSEVAEIYGHAFAAAESKSAPAKDEEELRQVLRSPDAPTTVPNGAIVDLEWYFIESVRVELAKLAADIDRWIVQSPGAPAHAVILEDKPLQKPAHVFRRGNPSNKGEEAPRHFLEILSGPDRKPFTNGSGRFEMANAIADPRNPLTARVMVNRIWAHHFGSGLVRTTSDFGLRADAPSHPELLDWLANYFVENGWSQKKLHRLIMLSAVYQQTSDAGSRSADGFSWINRSIGHRATAESVDPENRLLWRFNRHRLDFEALRDSILFVSGAIDLKMGGKGEDLFKPPFSKHRSIYGFIDRQFMANPYRIFDFANPDLHNPQRSETTVPQQALFFMNGGFVVEQSKALAKRCSSGTPAASVRQLYQTVFQRAPSQREMKLALDFLRSAEAEAVDPEPLPQVSSDWKYGVGEFDESAKVVKGFKPLPHFTGDAWQGGKRWPDSELGWAQLTATGGHAGNDLQHAVIRRWVAPVDGAVAVSGEIKHERVAGHGVRAFVHSSRHGTLGKWVLHNKAAEVKIATVDIKKGDFIDFIVSIHQSLNSNDFAWAPVIEMVGPTAIRDANGYARAWNAKKDFAGPLEYQEPLTPWEKYAQVLMLSNEFLFVD